MAEQSVRYRKLSGRGVGWSGVSRLWLGEDHLISVCSAFGFETYQRFYLRDIEAVIVRRTKVRLIWNCIFGAIVASGVAFGMMSQVLGGMEAGNPAQFAFNAVILAFLGGPTVVALICMLINTFRGASCAVWIQTGGGTERLGAPVRIPAARRVIDMLTPLIEQAQTQTTRQSSTTTVNSPT